MSTQRSPAHGLVLRLGVVRDRRLTHEQLVPLTSPVTVGVGAQTTVPIPDNGIPEGFPEACVLVSPQDGVPVLHVHPGMTGRLVWPGHTVDLDHLGDAVPATLPLRPGVRGKVRIGPTTILLQLVPAPAVQTLPGSGSDIDHRDDKVENGGVLG